MKQNDIALILVIVFIAGIFAVVVSKFTIGSPKNRQQKAEVVQPITSEFLQPDKRYYNAEAVNPTQLIQIKNNTNTKPF